MAEETVVVIECATCRHHATAYDQLLCCQGALPTPCTSARDYRSECGPAGKFFTLIKERKS